MLNSDFVNGTQRHFMFFDFSVVKKFTCKFDCTHPHNPQAVRRVFRSFIPLLLYHDNTLQGAIYSYNNTLHTASYPQIIGINA